MYAHLHPSLPPSLPIMEEDKLGSIDEVGLEPHLNKSNRQAHSLDCRHTPHL